MKENHKLGVLGVALMYVGAIMGAGFASGREIWQYFGLFGVKGFIGVAVVGCLLMAIGVMTSRIARSLHTNDMGKVIVPGNHPGLIEFVGYFMAIMLFTVLVAMSAACGALFHQQFGQSRIVGGMLITALVILTVIGGFERVAKVFRCIMPLLLCVVLSLSLIVIFSDLPKSSIQAEMAPSPFAPNWILAAMIYVSYNILAVIPIVATASINAKNDRTAVTGTILGALFLGALAFLLTMAMFRDMGFSQAMDMPMLAYSARISKGVNVLYTSVLLFAIYSSATSNYYGFTTKIKPSPTRKLKIILLACLGFIFGLIGFTNVVAFVLPIEGLMGFVIIAMITMNYRRVMKMDKKIAEEDSQIVSSQQNSSEDEHAKETENKPLKEEIS
ncbi:YkvI family membrane protein [Clostridium aminobutyricum]|uniref:Transporter n=1 Tax=Clostridium aminobutyricum TaxID=33953 RepID=A0A939D7M9_CLOAM|nr:hypothetical protein [Clostridium aminobutyricum]MBN7772248.1 hypothetical protein [Clostridium aminobutyricum]